MTQAEIELKKIVEGASLLELKKYGFYRISVKNNVWIFKNDKDIILEIEVQDMKCEKFICNEDEWPKLKKIINIKKEKSNFEFNNPTECEILSLKINRESIFDKIKYLFCKQ